MSVETLVRLEDLHVSYAERAAGRGAESAIVRGVDLELGRGEVLGLVGESGCGKTTLARAVVGLAPIVGGKLFWCGRDITGLSLRARRQAGVRSRMVFQDPQGSLNPRMPVWRLVTEAAVIEGARPRDLKELAAELLVRVKLPPELIDRRPFELSGGQRQRLAIARAICGPVDLIVLDEPTSALDVTVQSQILDLLAELRSETQASFLFISHDLHVVRRICDRVAIMLGGKIVEQGDVASVLGAPSEPYTRSLLAATPSLRRVITAPAAP